MAFGSGDLRVPKFCHLQPLTSQYEALHYNILARSKLHKHGSS